MLEERPCARRALIELGVGTWSWSLGTLTGTLSVGGCQGYRIEISENLGLGESAASSMLRTGRGRVGFPN